MRRPGAGVITARHGTCQAEPMGTVVLVQPDLVVDAEARLPPGEGLEIKAQYFTGAGEWKVEMVG
jgi:hypothetical protein